jgi:hypothetical protein
MTNKLLLADAGYLDFEFLKNVERHNGSILFRVPVLSHSTLRLLKPEVARAAFYLSLLE